MNQEVLQIKTELTEAIQKKDAVKANNLYNDTSVLFLLAPPLQEKVQNGIDSINDLEKWFDTFKGNIQLESKEMVIACENHIAYLHSLEHLMGHRIDGSFTDIWFRETLCFLKSNNEWKITHQHQSFPMYMDGSDKAATDLMP